MSSIKITINNEDRVVVIPMEYDSDKDETTVKEIQIEPMPEEKDDISKDVVLLLAQVIMNAINGTR